MKIVHYGAISTAIVILLGIAMVIPPFIQPTPPLIVLLSFSLINDNNAPSWCNDISSILEKQDVKAVVFVTGKAAERHPECVKAFPDTVDIGSQTYHYVSLTSISDYTYALEEIQSGKKAVDNAGRLSSKLFKAPYGDTDENIYSLLNRSDILADFSYQDEFNKYYNGEFIKLDLVTYDGTAYPANFFQNLTAKDGPVQIVFDDKTSPHQVDDFISKIKSRHIKFVSASELAGIDLTVRETKKA
jgi:peptidoglycan/xylan/chitin deacetylase (PgdA/CDA1 family)